MSGFGLEPTEIEQLAPISMSIWNWQHLSVISEPHPGSDCVLADAFILKDAKEIHVLVETISFRDLKVTRDGSLALGYELIRHYGANICLS